MVKRMFLDLFVFACLLLLLMLGYGIAVQALIFPERAFDGYSVLNIIYKYADLYIHTYMHTYIHIYIHTYIRRYAHRLIQLECRDLPQ